MSSRPSSPPRPVSTSGSRRPYSDRNPEVLGPSRLQFKRVGTGLGSTRGPGHRSTPENVDVTIGAQYWLGSRWSRGSGNPHESTRFLHRAVRPLPLAVVSVSLRARPDLSLTRPDLSPDLCERRRAAV